MTCLPAPFLLQQMYFFLLVLATDNQVWRFGRTKCTLNPSFSPFQVDDSKLFKELPHLPHLVVEPPLIERC